MKSLIGNDTVERILRIAAGAVGCILLLLGLGFVIMPEVLATAMFVEPVRAIGINTLRGDFGALFLGMSFFCLLGTFSAHRWMLLVPIAFLVLIIAGRTVSIAIDDLPLQSAGQLISELVFLTVLGLALLAHALNSRTESMPPVLRTVFGLRSLTIVGFVLLLIVGALAARRQIGMELWNGLSGRGMARDPIGELPDGLHVGLAGTGSPLPEARRKGASMFVLAGKRLFIVDSGPGSTVNLELMRVPLGATEAVLLTHLHSDHIAGLGELMLKAWTGGNRTEPLKILGPAGVDTVVQGFNQALSVDAGFRTAHHGPTVAAPSGNGGVAETIETFDQNQAAVIFRAQDLHVTAFLVDHRPSTPALGYRFDYKGRSVVISGDTMPSETLRAQARGADLLLHEALQPKLLSVLQRAAARNGRTVPAKVFADIPSYHTSPEEAARIARDAGAGHLVLYHLIPPVPVAMLHPAFIGDAAQYYDGPITIGAEGTLFSLLPDTTKISRTWLLR